MFSIFAIFFPQVLFEFCIFFLLKGGSILPKIAICIKTIIEIHFYLLKIDSVLPKILICIKKNDTIKSQFDPYTLVNSL